MSASRFAILICLLAALLQAAAQIAQPGSMPGMGHMTGHMYLTSLRPMQPGDQQKADEVVAAARQAMAPYQDFHNALADGYRISLSNVPQPIYHFTKSNYARQVRWTFDPLNPPRSSTEIR